MATTRPVRGRTVLVAGTAALVVLTAAGSVTAHEGSAAEGTVHACASTATGALRVLADATQECRRSETPMHWTVGDGSSDELEAFKAELAAGTAELAVGWDDLTGVPDVLADGRVRYDELTGVLALPDGSVRGGAGGVVADGSIGPSDIGAVVSTGTDSVAPALLAGGTDVPTVRPVVTTDEESLVMVTGQVQLSLSTCTCRSVVHYQVVRTGGAAPVAVSPTYQLQLSGPDHTQDVAGVAVSDTVGAGTHGYAIRWGAIGDGSTGAGRVDATDPVLTVQVLGGS